MSQTYKCFTFRFFAFLNVYSRFTYLQFTNRKSKCDPVLFGCWRLRGKQTLIVPFEFWSDKPTHKKGRTQMITTLCFLFNFCNKFFFLLFESQFILLSDHEFFVFHLIFLVHTLFPLSFKIRFGTSINSQLMRTNLLSSTPFLTRFWIRDFFPHARWKRLLNVQ